MLLNLVVRKPECLHAILEGRLSSTYFSEEVNSLGIVREGLLDVVVGKVYYAIPVLPN